jgi:hypothetical protein
LLEYLNVKRLEFLCGNLSEIVILGSQEKGIALRMAPRDVDCKDGKWMELTRFSNGGVEPP